VKNFIGRTAELDVLERHFASDDSVLLPVYGRRRVGKSELILEFIKNKPAIHFIGKQSPEEAQVREFLEVAAREFREPLLAETAISTWSQALDLVVDRWRGPGKLIVALDEFQWMAAHAEALPSHLQHAWDGNWSRSNKIMLILCGSYVGFMEREVLGGKSPLFGRRSGQILLRPFDYREARRFHPGYGPVDWARTYFLTGGMPYYLQCFDQRLSLEENVITNVLDQYSVLFREPDFLLHQELRDVEKYFAILQTLGARTMAPSDLAKATGIGTGSLGYYRDRLIELGYVDRRHPVVASNRRRPKTVLGVADPLLRFWFTFVYPNLSHLSRVGPRKLFADRIRPELPRYFGACFDLLCREALPLLYLAEGVSADFEVGDYWDKSTQIDVVGLRDDNWIDLGECKWGTVKSVKALVHELEAKVRAYPNQNNATIGRRIFTRDEVPSRSLPSGWRCHHLAELYRL